MFLHDPLTPELIRTTVPVILKLCNVMIVRGSQEEFDQLCHLLGENIIGSIWVYSGQEPETMMASMDILSPVVRALGIGTARYLIVSEYSIFRRPSRIVESCC